MSKIMTQRIIAIKRETRRAPQRALCLVASLRICVCVWSAYGYYVPAFTTNPYDMKFPVPSPVQNKAATAFCLSCDALFVELQHMDTCAVWGCINVECIKYPSRNTYMYIYMHIYTICKYNLDWVRRRECAETIRLNAGPVTNSRSDKNSAHQRRPFFLEESWVEFLNLIRYFLLSVTLILGLVGLHLVDGINIGPGLYHGILMHLIL